MQQIRVIILLLSSYYLAQGLVLPATEPQVTCGKSPPATDSHAFPWMARIIYSQDNGTRTFGCMGFLIDAGHVLTGAECVRRKEKFGQIESVILGDDTITGTNDSEPHRQVIGVHTTIAHKDYCIRNHANDIALLRLHRQAHLNAFVAPICLDSSSSKPMDEWRTIAGWGCDEAIHKDHKQISRVDNEECFHRVAAKCTRLDMQKQICAADVGYRYECIGVPGTPLMYQDDAGRWYAEAIYSFTYIEEPITPGVYALIKPYHNWIKNKKKKYMRNKKVNAVNETQVNNLTPYMGTYLNGFDCN